MKKTVIIYPFLFALYPMLGLYARNLTEIQPWEVIRPIVIALFAAGLVMWLLNRLLKDRERSAFLAAFLVFFFSASELAYRVIEGYLIHGLNEAYHRVLLLVVTAMLLFLGSRAVWDKYMLASRRKLMVEYLNLVSIIILIFPLYNIGVFWSKAFDDAPRLWSSYVGLNEPSQTLSTGDSPDIYYIILDGYGRADALAALYGFDNSPFLDELHSRGFYIGAQSQSNYLRTSLSITSALNMEYVNFTAALAGAESTNRIPMFELASNNRARQLLEQAGYQFVLVDSGSAFSRFYDADTFVTPFKSRPNLFEMWFYSTTALGALYQPELPITPALQEYLPVAGYATHRAFIVDALDKLSSVPEIRGPKFVFAHIIAPHPPFVLDENGNPLRPDYPYVTGDGASFVSDKEYYIQGYIGQVKYLNERILAVVDDIIKKSARPPVIIIQGDHGPGLLLMNGDTPDNCLWERASILNVYYFPENKTGALYPSISPINSFRTIFNTYFGTSFDLLPDKTYYSLFELPYNFLDITDKVRSECGITP
ncbi:MAG: sulfatase-like hydrolase/transferase [Anaerolineales bacterium]|nr:sulfatase-like hydrolase/transferase [Anaerolineales bacterium]